MNFLRLRSALALAAVLLTACGDSSAPPAGGGGAPSGPSTTTATSGPATSTGPTSTTSSTSGASTTGAGGATGGAGGATDDAGDAGDGARDVAGDASGADASMDQKADAPAGTRVVLFAGGGNGGDGVQATAARLMQPFAVARDPKSGDFYIAEYQGNRIRRVDTNGVITTVVGAGAPGDGGRITLNQPHHIVFPPAGGDLFIGDTFNSRLYRYNPTSGAIAQIAANAGFGKTFCLAFDPKGEKLYVADTDNKRVRAIDLGTMMVTTVAGSGATGKPTDGATATMAPLVDPRAIAVDSKGNLYILERDGNALRVVDVAGKITTVAGTGQVGNSGDGGNPLMATMNGPKHVGIDLEDNVLIADTENHVVRKLLVNEKKIVRLAGTGMQGGGGVPGPPLGVELARPHGVFVAPDGTIFLSDSLNNRVLRIQ